MANTTHTPLQDLGVSPLAPALAGALAVLVFGGASLPSIATATALGAAGAWAGLRQRARTRALTQAIEGYLQQQRQFGEDMAPVWCRHIESSREQMETAITQLSRRFSGIAAKLDEAVRTASLEADIVEDRDRGLVAVFERSEKELDAVIAAQQQATSRMVGMLEQVQGLDRFVEELQGMAAEVAKIAQQTSLLSLNAAIEAARGGEFGRGFAVVAQEFRMLSSQSGETGRRMAEKVGVIGAAITRTCAVVGDSVQQEDRSMDEARATIGRVMADFRAVTDALQRSSKLLEDESVGIKSEIGEALVQLQFQDRVSQIMNHVNGSIGRLPEVMKSQVERYASSGELPPLDAHEMLDELKKTYVMTDQHQIHAGEKVVQKDDTEITFF